MLTRAKDLVDRFVGELDFFLQMTELEQETQLSGEMPSPKDYLRRRMGSGAVGVCLPMTE